MEASFSIGAATAFLIVPVAVPEGGVGFEDALARSLLPAAEAMVLPITEAMLFPGSTAPEGGASGECGEAPLLPVVGMDLPVIDAAALPPAVLPPVEMKAGPAPEDKAPVEARPILDKEAEEGAGLPDAAPPPAPPPPSLSVPILAAPIALPVEAAPGDDGEGEAAAEARPFARGSAVRDATPEGTEGPPRRPRGVSPLALPAAAPPAPAPRPDGVIFAEAVDPPAGPGPLSSLAVPHAPAERSAVLPAISDPPGAALVPVPEWPAPPASRPGPVPALPPSLPHGPAAPPPARQVASIAVALAFRAGASRGFDLSLEPAELGRVTVRVEQEGDRHSIRVVAERPETLALLLRDRNEFDRGLAEAGLRVEPDGIRFSLDGEGAAGQDGRPAPRRPGRSTRGEASPAGTESRPAPRGLLDLQI